jgi:hypothetical protein
VYIRDQKTKGTRRDHAVVRRQLMSDMEILRKQLQDSPSSDVVQHDLSIFWYEKCDRGNSSKELGYD